MEELLRDAYDLHIHCGPDIIPRKVDDKEMALRAVAKGMKGFAIKSHYTPTAERAAVVRKEVPACHAVGAVTLNSTVGGINPMAVEAAARLGAGIVWCPTFDSASQQSYYLERLPQYVTMQAKLVGRRMAVPSYCLIDKEGRLVRQMQEVFDLVQEYGLMLGTGHITHQETFALAEEAKKRGFKKLVITHADWEFTAYSLEEQKRLVELGAVIEHSYTSPAEGYVSWEAVAAQIRGIGPEHVILSTDLGQVKNEYPDEGFGQFLNILWEMGFSREELYRMTAENTAALVE